jgi:anti-sigma B factor antagonist
MALSIQTEISGDVFILRCNGRIVYGDECAVMRERVVNMLSGSPKIIVNIAGVDHIDSEGMGMLVGLLVSTRNRAGELKLASPCQRVTDLLRRTNLDGVFSVCENNDDAIADFRKHIA